MTFVIFRQVAGVVAKRHERIEFSSAEVVHNDEALEFAGSMQVELRTPPSDWGATTPSPRLFGLDRDEWRSPSPCVGGFERLKEFE